MKKFFLIIIIASAAIGCKDSGSKTVENTSDTVLRSASVDSAVQQVEIPEEPVQDSVYAYIKKITKNADSKTIDADYIQFLTGDAAINAAKKNHEADTSYDDKGKITDIAVMNDYYIVNDNKMIRTMKLARDVKIEAQVQNANRMELRSMSLNDFAAKGNKNGLPFILKLRNNEVISVSEVYLP